MSVKIGLITGFIMIVALVTTSFVAEQLLGRDITDVVFGSAIVMMLSIVSAKLNRRPERSSSYHGGAAQYRSTQKEN